MLQRSHTPLQPRGAHPMEEQAGGIPGDSRYNRDLKPEEARYVTELVRRIAALLLLGPALDANYQVIRKSPCNWPGKTDYD